MKAAHSYNLINIQKDSDDPLLLTGDRKNSYAFLGSRPFSRYGGIYLKTELGMLKVLEEIIPDQPEECDEIVNAGPYTQRIFGHVTQSIAMPPHEGALIVMSPQKAVFRIFADVKKPFDNRTLGRYYTLTAGHNHVTIEFTKKTDRAEDPSHGEKEFTLYVVIYSEDFDYYFRRRWVERSYYWDEKRGSPPYKRWVFEAARLKCSKMCVAASTSREKAKRKARRVYRKYLSLSDLTSMNDESSVMPHEAMIAYDNAAKSLELLATEEGLFAGFPWFTQVWVRDAAISARGLWLSGNALLAKRMLLKAASAAGPEGRCPSVLGQKSARSADGLGWVFHRLREMNQEGLLTAKERRDVHKKLLHAAYLQSKFCTAEGLDYCEEGESWMDSLNRGGFLVEHQALRASMYEFLSDFKETREYYALLSKLRRRFRERFLKNGIVTDSPNDDAVRPNLFLAAYTFPDFLTRTEWEKSFDHALERLWLEWGGLSTLDKESPVFRHEHTGENPASYHNGDSWYFINNIAAISMLRINREKYKDRVERIITSGLRDNLWLGCIGHSSELSSAKEQRAEGSPCQAWSAATLIELLHEYYEKSD